MRFRKGNPFHGLGQRIERATYLGLLSKKGFGDVFRYQSSVVEHEDARALQTDGFHFATPVPPGSKRARSPCAAQATNLKGVSRHIAFLEGLFNSLTGIILPATTRLRPTAACDFGIWCPSATRQNI